MVLLMADPLLFFDSYHGSGYKAWETSSDNIFSFFTM